MSTSTRADTEATDLDEQMRYRPRWWREVLYIAIFYGLYSFVRNLNGSVVSVSLANDNAERIVRFERWLHVFHEEQIQQFFLHARWFIKFLNVWYGTAHFIVTVGVLLWLFHLQTDRYRQWRNVLLATTALALVGYTTFPLAPPRLLPAHYGFVDTLDTIGGLWNFESGKVKEVSNQYAAMPSLHVGWSVWCAGAIMPVLRRSWTRILVAIYPATTITAIVVTANHYWADVWGGLIIFACGYLVAAWLDRRWRRRHPVGAITPAPSAAEAEPTTTPST